MKIAALKCEYITNPIGIDIALPQLSWQVITDERNFLQTAYQIVLVESNGGFNHHNKLIWNSGKINSVKSTGIIYNGAALQSRKRYYWKVQVWDTNTVMAESNEPAYFEMGLLNQSDWAATWIGCPASWTGRVLYFRREFFIKKSIKNARVYISSPGYYVLHINGEKVGDHVMDPGTSDYSKRIYYVTYDVTGLLKEKNVFGIIVGPGWYGLPKLRMQAEITYEDGDNETIATCWDPFHNWLVSTGPIISSSIFDGERYDAREEKINWSSPDYIPLIDSRTSQWINAVVTDAPGGKMFAQLQEPIKIIETIVPEIIHTPSQGIYVFDAGRNLAGWACIKVKGQRGDKITLRFAESVNEDRSVNQENLRSAAAKDVYIIKGEGEECWEPCFTYHGFRYVQIEGLLYHPQANDLQVKVVRSSVEKSGSFHCSNDLLNQIHQMVFNTEASNLHSIPTDCPQRDERMGWLNDMTVRIEQAVYNFDLACFYHKWINDIKDTQEADGSITDTAPFRWGFRPADPVSASYLLTALKSYEFYGNQKIIIEHYNGLKAWVNFLQTTKTTQGIVNYSYWGDWSPPEAFGVAGSVGSGAVSAFTPGTLISTGYLFYCHNMLARMASILCNNKEEEFYQELAKKTAIAFNQTFWDEEKGGYGSNNQACNSFALYLGLVENKNISRVIANLIRDISENDFHLTTGNLCTKYLLEVLTENGHAEVAYRIVTQQTYPGWGYMLANGATTLWERWENKTGGEMNSHNHPMMGSVGSWFYKYLVGIIPMEGSTAFETFRIKPFIPEQLEFAEGEYQSVKGIIKSKWRKKDGFLYLNITVPPNTIATVFIPTKNPGNITESNHATNQVKNIAFLNFDNNYATFKVGSGIYMFKSDWQ
jgi:alpha-L-rhamnosidase